MRRMYSEEQVKKMIQNALSSGDMKDVKVFENIVDKDGHPRFIEGDIIIATITGVSKIYGKWSLAGTHLMIVLCLSLADTTTIADNTALAAIDLPSWIVDKIYPIVSSVIAYKIDSAYASNYTKQDFGTRMNKASETRLTITKEANITLTTEKVVRISYDLLIDNE